MSCGWPTSLQAGHRQAGTGRKRPLQERSGEHFLSGPGCGGESKARAGKPQVCGGQGGRRPERNRKFAEGGEQCRERRTGRPGPSAGTSGPICGCGPAPAVERGGGDPGAGPQDGAEQPGGGDAGGARADPAAGEDAALRPGTAGHGDSGVGVSDAGDGGCGASAPCLPALPLAPTPTGWDERTGVRVSQDDRRPGESRRA